MGGFHNITLGLDHENVLCIQMYVCESIGLVMWTQLFAKAFAERSNDDKYSPGLENSFFQLIKRRYIA